MVPSLTPVSSVCLCLSGFPQWLSRPCAAQPVRTKAAASSGPWHWAHPRAPLLWGETRFLLNFIVIDSQSITSLYRFILGVSLVVVLKCFLHVCQDEDEFPDLATGGAVQRSTKAESTAAQTHTQPKLPKNLVRERLNTPSYIQMMHIHL